MSLLLYTRFGHRRSPRAVNHGANILVHRYVWPKSWGLSYANSYAICISTNGLSIIMCYIFKRHLENLNRELAKKEEEEGRPAGFRYIS